MGSTSLKRLLTFCILILPFVMPVEAGAGSIGSSWEDFYQGFTNKVRQIRDVVRDGFAEAVATVECKAFDLHCQYIQDHVPPMKSDTGFECALAKTKKEILASPPKLPERLKELNDPPALAAAAAKLLDVNQWGEKTAMANMGNLSIGKTDFKLYHANGRIANRPAQEGDFVKITLPVPPPMSGVSWVRISHVSVTHRKIPGLTLGTLKAPSLPVKGLSIEVNPTYDPRPVDDDGKPRKVTPRFTDHFFDSKTSNFFNVEQIGDRVVTSVHGRNENTNLDECADPGIQRRNVLIAIAGIGYNAKQEGLIGMQKMTWRNFTKNLSKSVCENPEKAAGYKI